MRGNLKENLTHREVLGKQCQEATSVLLPGFAVDVAACFAAGKEEA
jgi:hypothetical protein